MRRTMVGVAPAANTPQAFDGARTLATNRDAASGHENADTAVALPPEMVKALGERTMLSAQEPEHAAAPMTMRMSEAPPKAPIPLPSGAPGSPIAAKGPRSAPSIAPSAPRGSPSVPPPRLASSVGLGGAAREGATTLAPATDPMAAPLPLERRPLVTTYALSPIAVAPPEAPVAAAAPAAPVAPAMPVEAPPPGSRSVEPTRVAAVIEPDVSGVEVVAPEVAAPEVVAPMVAAPVIAAPLAISPVRTIGPGQRASAMPPPHASVPPAAGTIKGMPLVSASAPPQGSLAPAPAPALAPVAVAAPRVAAPPEAASPLPASRLMVGDGTMVLAPTNAPLAPTVSMPPMPPAMPAGMSQVSQSSRAAIPAAPPRTAPPQPGPSKLPSSPQHLAQHAAPQQHAPMPPLQRPPLPSHPSLAETRSPSDEQPAALTYQVFNPASSPTGREPALSRVSFPEPGVPKASVGLRVCLVLLGVCVVVGTAGAIILSGADDPPKAAPANAPSASVSAAPTPPPLPSPPPPAPPAPAVVIGDPVPAPVVPPIATTSAKPAASGKPKPTGSAALKGAKIPPNPFGAGGTLPAKRK